MKKQRPLKNLDDLNQTNLASPAKDAVVPNLRIPHPPPAQPDRQLEQSYSYRHLLDDDHPTENEIKQEQRIDGQETPIFLDLRASQEIHRGCRSG